MNRLMTSYNPVRLMMLPQTPLVLGSVYLLYLVIAFYLLVLCYSWSKRKSLRYGNEVKPEHFLDCLTFLLQAKHLQFVSGVHSSSYWMAIFTWDLLNALVPIILSIVIFATFQVDAFSEPESLLAIFLLLVRLIIILLYIQNYFCQCSLSLGSDLLGVHSIDILGIVCVL